MHKKIVIATGIFPPQIGGPATYSLLLSQELPKRGFSVRVASFGDVLWLPKIFRHVVYFLKLFRVSLGVDIIYAQDPVSVGLPACLVAKILRKKFYLKIVGDYAWEQSVQRMGVSDTLDVFSRKTSYSFPVRLLKIIQKSVARYADLVITPSLYLKGIITNWGVRSDSIRVIYNGFNQPTVSFSKEEARKDLGVNGFVVISVGRLVPWKGFAAVINSMATLRARVPGAQLLIVGSGPDEAKLKEYVKDLSLEDTVKFLGGLSQEKLFKYIVASDVFVLNTKYEGFSHQLLEVASLGVPIVTTPVGGNTELIKDKEDGIFVPVDDVGALSDVLEELHKNTILCQDLSNHAREKVSQFSEARMLDLLVKELS